MEGEWQMIKGGSESHNGEGESKVKEEVKIIEMRDKVKKEKLERGEKRHLLGINGFFYSKKNENLMINHVYLTSGNWHNKDKGTGRKRRAKIRKEGYRGTEKRKKISNQGI